MTSDIGKDRSASSLPTIDEQKQYWDHRWDRERIPNEYQTRRGEEILSFLRTVKLERPKILDIGCGTGWFTAQLGKIGNATGIDLSETAIEIARSDYPGIDYVCGDLYTHSFSRETFDVVVSQEVLPHVQDQVSFLELIRGILKPDGYLALTMVNKFVIERAEWDHGPSSHIISWLSKKEIMQMLKPNFEILQSRTVMPVGNKGILRVVNSQRLNKLISGIVSRQTLESFKERAGLGYTRIIFARKVS